jgi:hypothetical protein
MSAIDPIDTTRIGPVERIVPPARRERREPREDEREEPGEPEQERDGDPVDGGHVDIRI